MSREKRFIRAVASAALVAVTIIWLLPLIWMLISSFRDPSDPFYFGVLPSHLTLANYAKVLSNPLYLSSMRNSTYVASLAACLNLVIATLAAYGFTRYEFKGREGLQALLLVVRLFPGILLAITLFRVAGQLGLYDTHVPLIVANVLFTLPFATWNLRTMFRNLPIEFEEAAWLDGASRLGGIVRVLIPLMLPGLVTTWAYVFILSWNEYLFALSFIRTPSKQMITTAIASNIGQYNIDFGALVAAAMLASIPILAIFMVIQRNIVSGLAVGGVKG